MRIVACTPDLMFSTRIRSALERAGHTVRVVDTRDEVVTGLEESDPALFILDIGAFGWDWEEALRAAREVAPGVPVLVFGSHMDVEATRQAQALGATRVVARSEFVNNMVGLAERYGKLAE